METSALDQKTSRFQRENLIRNAEVRRLEPLNKHERRLGVPGQDEGDQKRREYAAKLRIIAPRIARPLLVARHRDMEVAATLVIRMHHRAEGAMLVVFALTSANFVVAPVRVTVPTRSVTTLFVRPAVRDRNAQHLPRSKRDHPLHEEQEHGDEFDQ